MGQVFTEGKWIHPDDIRPGDEIQVLTNKEVVRRVQRWTDGSTVYTKPPENAPNAEGAYFSGSSRFILVRRNANRPTHWPPQNGDVWSDGITEVHVVHSGIYDAAGGLFPNVEHLIRNHPDIKLVYRKGNEL